MGIRCRILSIMSSDGKRSALSIWFLVTALVLPFLFTPHQLYRQALLACQWSPFWHTNTHLAAYCPLKALSCVTEMKCLTTIGCINSCMLDNYHKWDQVAACAYICEMTHGYENEKFHDLIHCMLDNGALEQYPQDGPCKGEDTDAVTNVQTMDDIKGDWWVLWGVNCGEAPYPGGYDWYPCQHERFIQQDNGQWINNVTYCGGRHDKCDTNIIVTIANVSMAVPGVVHHDYVDAPLAPQSEDWRLVSFPHPDYAFMMWCGRLPVLDYAGGIVISRHRTAKDLPEQVLAEFQGVAQKFGIDWTKMCPSNNDHCPI